MNNLFKILFVSISIILISTTLHAQSFFSTGNYQLYAGTYGNFFISTSKGSDTLDHFNRISPLVTGNDFQVYDAFNDGLVTDSVFLKNQSRDYDYAIEGTFDTSYSGLPPAFLVTETIYGWKDKSFAVIKLKIKNADQVQLSSMIGLDIEASIDGTFENDSIAYNSGNQTLYLFDTTYFGIKIINADVHTAYTFPWYDSYMLSDTNYYNWMTGGIKDSVIYGTDEYGGVAILGTTPFNLNPNDSAEVYFGIAFGDNEASMLQNLDSTLEKFIVITSVSPEPVLVQSYSLSQNYPNPFNPSTKISFNIPSAEFVTLKVFNILGQEVAELLNREVEAGTHIIDFDASILSSGIYLYQITAGSFTSTRKMTLLK